MKYYKRSWGGFTLVSLFAVVMALLFAGCVELVYQPSGITISPADDAVPQSSSDADAQSTATPATRALTGYWFGNSDTGETAGKAVLIPPMTLAGSIDAVTVDGESFVYDRIWRGREVWAGKKQASEYKEISLKGKDGATYTATIEAQEATEQPAGDNTTTEACIYHGRYNGDRATFYCQKDMDEYPSTFQVEIPDYKTVTVANNNGHRATPGGFVIKQSEVSGRHLAITVPKSYKGKECNIKY